ncbi:hypothetical protein D9M72_482840 [compost metagenome]
MSTGRASTSATWKSAGLPSDTSAQVKTMAWRTADVARLPFIVDDHFSCSCSVTRPRFLNPAAEMRAMTFITVP